ncbi:hypothetical protein N781_01385 [Pontibacillus halophilus JSM 076056 = DSM 19796]|uniref:N-acetyltransferase domain-containing protein n=1 Tax=Pontibacillus halophilus JSM 076056 = DSM 19796 TaxID=1385510 RepID=A0A0A5GSF7_9BACI|nr:hypothetical protein [Pontibacillus halophilus]KGX94075.1 hypothetical protein N781_01385 [Pontibacillus halophilus JSM 076056 = DSM 19796]
MIEVKRTNEYEREDINKFFQTRLDTIKNEPQLLHCGWFVEMEGETSGFFSLVPVTERAVWIRSVLLKEGMDPAFIMTVMQLVQKKAEEEGYQDVYVLCHQSALEPLFLANQFTPIEESAIPSELHEQDIPQGSWWRFEIN